MKSRNVRVMILLLSMLIVLPTYSADQAALRVVATVPLIYDPPIIPVPLIRLSINGKPPALFALGSSLPALLVIGKEKASELGLESKGGWAPLQSVHLVDEHGSTANELGIPAAYIAEGMNSMRQVFLGLDVAGFLGSNFFATLPVELDLREKKLRLYNNSVREILEAEKEGYIAVRLIRPSPENWVHTVQVSVPGNRELEMLVSTGSWRSSLSASDLRTVELSEIACLPFYMGRLDSAPYPAIPTYLGLLEWLEIGGVKVQKVPCMVKLNIDERDSHFGMDILSLFERVILDYRNGYLLLKKPQGALTPHADGLSGVTLQQDKQGKLRVEAVNPHSAGDRAGFRKDDEILAIDNRPVETLTLAQAQVLLNGYAGIPQRVKILREGSSRELLLTPDSYFEGGTPLVPLVPQGKGFGFHAVHVVEGWSPGQVEGFLLVTKITSEAARKAGLRVGDRIVAIEGQTEWNKAQLHELYQRDELRLTILRPGEREKREIRIPRQL